MKTRIIHTKFYQDNFILSLNQKERWLFLYLISNERVEKTGAYELPLSIAEVETGINKDEIIPIIKKFNPKIIYVEGYVIIKNIKKYQDYSKGSKKQIESYNKEYASLPENVKSFIDNNSKLVTNQLETSFKLVINNKYKRINNKEEEEESEEKEKHKQVYQEYLDIFNEVMNKSNRILDKKTIKQLKDLKEAGYTLEDWRNACIGASKDKFITGQNDNQKNYATPEFISRPTKFEQYLQLENDRKLLREKELIAKFGRKL